MFDFGLAYNMTADTVYENCQFIHPLMQLEVYRLIEHLKPRGLKQLVIFGSSVELRCTHYSDLDFYAAGCSINDVYSYEPLRKIDYDAIITEMIPEGSPLREQIRKTGVEVYGNYNDTACSG